MNCQDCDQPIPAKRLAAKPDACYCVGCQPRHDEPLLAVLAVPSRIDEIDGTNFALVPAKAARLRELPDGVTV